MAVKALRLNPQNYDIEAVTEIDTSDGGPIAVGHLKIGADRIDFSLNSDETRRLSVWFAKLHHAMEIAKRKAKKEAAASA